jgi:hypothetical protein
MVPLIKEVFDDNEILHHFINFMHSQNSIAVLQLYLTLSNYEIFPKLSNAKIIYIAYTDDLLSTSCKERQADCNVRKQKQVVEPLDELKIWCNSPSNKLILQSIIFENEENLYDSINRIYSNNKLVEKYFETEVFLSK